MRDRFSALALLDFSSSGHLTISSLHSSNATTAIFRLERLGVDRSAMSEAISGIVAQKLLRTLCTSCREIGEITAEERSLLEAFTEDPPQVVARAVGCPACRETGYSGRQAVCEVIRVDQTVAEMIQKGESIARLRAHLAGSGCYLIGHHVLDRIRSRSIPVQEAYEQILIEELHLKDLPAEPPASPEAASPEKEAAPMILLVDDDPDFHALVEVFLTGAGYRMVSAYDGLEGMMELARTRIDLILSDIQMPNLDGVKLMEMITNKGVDVPAIFLTGATEDGLEAKVLSLGAADFMRKPISRDVLLLRVKKVLTAKGIQPPSPSESLQ